MSYTKNWHNYVSCAITKDGERIDGNEARRRLLAGEELQSVTFGTSDMTVPPDVRRNGFNGPSTARRKVLRARRNNK